MGYLDLVGSFVYKEPLFRAKLDALAENDAQLKTDGWAQSTKTLFYQATVPSGWTQDASQNDKALRVVGSTGGGVAGGSQALSSNVPLSHTHAGISSDGSHTHAYAAHTHGAGVTTNAIGQSSTKVVIDDGSGFLSQYNNSGGSLSAHLLTGTWASPGSITLGTTGTHDHGGVTGSALTDFVFAYCDVIIGTKNAPGGTYTDLTNYWHTGDKADFDPFQQSAFNDAYNLGNLMPSGTIMLFGQASAPAGWTKIASTNDRMLRVVSGIGAGTGGTQLISSGVSLAHTHSLPTQATHVHTVPAHQHQAAQGALNTHLSATPVPGGDTHIAESIAGTILATVNGTPTATRACYKSQTTSSGSGNTDSADSHTHDIPSSLADFTLAYVDVIQCSKDSAGAPWSYTDYTAEFAWKKLVTYQRLNTLAKNDAYIEFHTTPSASQAFFYMASAPTGWVKNTAQHDKALRMVSGGSGGNPGGGSQLLSATMALAHTHSIVADPDHFHTLAHTHPVDSANVATIAAPTNTYVQAGRSFLGPTFTLALIDAANPGGISSFMDKVTAAPNEQTGVAGTHDHDGVTDSQLTDITLAYADVIWCTKS